jgi:hypothetical protein
MSGRELRETFTAIAAGNAEPKIVLRNPNE